MSRQLPLDIGARPAALALYAGEVVWADAATGTLRACARDLCARPRVLRNDTGQSVVYICI